MHVISYVYCGTVQYASIVFWNIGSMIYYGSTKVYPGSTLVYSGSTPIYPGSTPVYHGSTPGLPWIDPGLPWIDPGDLVPSDAKMIRYEHDFGGWWAENCVNMWCTGSGASAFT